MGKYQLVRKLATGGMAEVFLAKAAGPMGFEKDLVVKRILPHLAEDPRFVEMFLAEAKLAARLNHANIVQIFDFGEEHGEYFLAMEYVDGPNLRMLARRAFQSGTPIPYALIARIVALICEGLAFAHELEDPQTGEPLGLIHRDISTDNILVSQTGGVKVVDFGIAKAVNGSQHTQAGVLRGKVAYMSPEHLRGTPLDSRTDIYALGVVLFELVAGRKPFEASSDVLLLQSVLYDAPTDVRTLRDDVPATLVAIIEKALAKDREARYQNCGEMQADLERFLFEHGKPVGAQQIAALVKQFVSATPGEKVERAASNPSLPVASTEQPPRRSLTPALPSEPRSRKAETVVARQPTSPPQAETVVARQPTSPSQAEPPRTEGKSIPIPLRIAVGLLMLLVGAGVIWWSLPRPVDAPSSAVRVAAPPTVVSSPNVQAPQQPAVEPQPPTVEPPPPSVAPTVAENPEASGAEDPPAEAEPGDEPEEQEPQETVAPAVAGASATLEVESNLRAHVRVNGKVVGRTPLTLPVKPGRMRVEVSGITRAGRFDKEQVVEVRTGQRRKVSFSILKMLVTIRGRPDDMRVLTLDGLKVKDPKSVTVHEGRHQLELLHPPTNRTYPASCEVRPGDTLCKFFVTPSR